jgi:hypothetical protein
MSAILPRKITGYSDISEQVLHEQSIIRSVSNLDVQGSPGTTAVSVFVNVLATVATYTPGTGVSKTQDTSAYVVLANLKEIAVNEILDGFTVETAPADIIASRFAGAVGGLAESVDTVTLAALETGGTELVAAAGATPTAALMYTKILALKEALDNAKAPRMGRSLILDPTREALMLDTDSKLVLNTDRGDRILMDGWIGRVAGFDVFSTTLIPAATNMIAMQKRGFAFKDNWKIEPRLQSLDGSGTFIGDSAIQARYAYNYGVVRATLIQSDNGRA